MYGINQPYMNPFQFQQQSGINGMYVDNRSVVDATQCDLSGKPIFLPTTDGNSIYVKQLDNLGKSHVTTYEKKIEPIVEPIADTRLDDIYAKLNELSDKIDKFRPYKNKKEPDKEVEE